MKGTKHVSWNEGCLCSYQEPDQRAMDSPSDEESPRPASRNPNLGAADVVTEDAQSPSASSNPQPGLGSAKLEGTKSWYRRRMLSISKNPMYNPKSRDKYTRYLVLGYTSILVLLMYTTRALPTALSETISRHLLNIEPLDFRSLSHSVDSAFLVPNVLGVIVAGWLMDRYGQSSGSSGLEWCAALFALGHAVYLSGLGSGLIVIAAVGRGLTGIGATTMSVAVSSNALHGCQRR